MRYLLRRSIFYLIALWAAVTIVFAIPRLMPGNPAATIFASHQQQFQNNPNAEHTIEALLGLSNAPMPVQYWQYLVQLAHGNFGISFTNYPTPVSAIIAQSLPWTIFLIGLAALIAFFVGTGIGIVAAWRRGGALDSLVPPTTLFISSFPFFFLALLLLWGLGFRLGWFPLGHSYEDVQPAATLAFVGNVLWHAVLPACSIIIVSLGGWLLGMRNTMINVLSEDYITMAQARGLTDRRVMLGYAARNAMLPQITGFALSLGYLVGGQVLVETIFNYPGMGYELVSAVGNEDYPLIQALLLIIVVAVLLANFVADLVYARLDPRTRAA